METRHGLIAVAAIAGASLIAVVATKRNAHGATPKNAPALACAALMDSEEQVWTLEGKCLEDAHLIFERPSAKKIAAGTDDTEFVAGTAAAESATPAARSPEEAARIEKRLRDFLRIRRSKEIWKAAERAFITMTPGSRAATTEAAMKAGLRPVDILAEWMTCEGATDLYLMSKVWGDQKSLKESVGAVVDTFFDPGAPAPAAAKGVKVVEKTGDRVVVSLFGAKVIEEIIPGKAVLADEGKVKVTWKSNYNYLRDVVRKKKPEELLEETLVRTDEGYGVQYSDWIGEFLAGADKQPWATILCTKGALALGEHLAARAGEASADEKPEEKKPDEKPEHGEHGEPGEKKHGE